MRAQSRLALFLGAGASQFAGYRTFADFPQLLFDEELRRAEDLPAIPPGPLGMLQQIKNALEATDVPTTHDNFLWRLDAYTQLLRLNQRDPVLKDYLRTAKLHDLYLLTDGAVDAMAKTTVRHYSANRIDRAQAVAPLVYQRLKDAYDLYRQLAILASPRSALPIFTTNYDMLLEDLFSTFRGDFRLNAGFDRDMCDGATWLAPAYERTKAHPERVAHLFRLHGCCCWFYHGHGDDNIYFHRRDAVQHSHRRLCAMYPGLEREKGSGPHGHAFKYLNQQLRSCDLIVFIGFSFRDDDVMHVLLNACADRSSPLKILVIDKSLSAADVRNRLQNAARRSTFVTAVPSANMVTSVRMSFGLDTDFARTIVEECVSLLKG